MPDKAIQDRYQDKYSVCFGCGRLNEHGLQIKSFDRGDECVAEFQPKPYHKAVNGFVYGGLIASLVDCHGTATAAAMATKARGNDPQSDPLLRFVTASLHVDFLRPTPMGVPLTLRGRVKEMTERRVIVDVRLEAEGKERVRGEVVAAYLPRHMDIAD